MKNVVRPLNIGRLRIDFPIALAALAGYSDLPYRLLCRSLSAPFCASEAMLDRQVISAVTKRRPVIRLDTSDHPLAGQIMGNEPAVMADAAEGLRELGFDVIDLNFACPVRKVISRKRGGYLMSQPDLALEIIRAVVQRVPDRPVTLKLRRSFLTEDKTFSAFQQIARGAFEAGVAAICIHARSVEQKYTGRADWNFLSLVKQEFPDKTIIGSGDVHTAADALKMIEETGVDGVVAARGAIGNPWIFRQARDLVAGRELRHPGLEEQHAIIVRHLQLLSDVYGPQRAIKAIRNFGIRYARMHPHPAKVRSAFISVRTEKDWQAMMDAWYPMTRSTTQETNL